MSGSLPAPTALELWIMRRILVSAERRREVREEALSTVSGSADTAEPTSSFMSRSR